MFRRDEAGRLELIEIGPGSDLERDVLAQMEFRPEIAALPPEARRATLLALAPMPRFGERPAPGRAARRLPPPGSQRA